MQERRTSSKTHKNQRKLLPDAKVKNQAMKNLLFQIKSNQKMRDRLVIFLTMKRIQMTQTTRMGNLKTTKVQNLKLSRRRDKRKLIQRKLQLISKAPKRMAIPLPHQYSTIPNRVPRMLEEAQEDTNELSKSCFIDKIFNSIRFIITNINETYSTKLQIS